MKERDKPHFKYQKAKAEGEFPKFQRGKEMLRKNKKSHTHTQKNISHKMESQDDTGFLE